MAGSTGHRNGKVARWSVVTAMAVAGALFFAGPPAVAEPRRVFAIYASLVDQRQSNGRGGEIKDGMLDGGFAGESCSYLMGCSSTLHGGESFGAQYLGIGIRPHDRVEFRLTGTWGEFLEGGGWNPSTDLSLFVESGLSSYACDFRFAVLPVLHVGAGAVYHHLASSIMERTFDAPDTETWRSTSDGVLGMSVGVDLIVPARSALFGFVMFTKHFAPDITVDVGEMLRPVDITVSHAEWKFGLGLGAVE